MFRIIGAIKTIMSTRGHILNLTNRTLRFLMRRTSLLFGCLGLAYYPSAVVAEIFVFQCNAETYTVNTSDNRVVLPSKQTKQIKWSYDGAWLRWTVLDSKQDFAINPSTGFLIEQGSAADQNCKLINSASVESLPISASAELRKYFISLNKTKRMEIQETLKILGFYNSAIDGLWGRGTETAINKFHNDQHNTEVGKVDYRSPNGAKKLIDNVLYFFDTEGDECDGCEETQIAIADNSQAYQFKHAGIKCNKTVDSLGGNKGGRSVMLYVRQSSETFDKQPALQNELAILLKQFPKHPTLNWQAAWLNFLANNYENTLKFATVAANQGEPNAAYLLGYIGLGLLDGQDSLQPDKTSRLTPVDLKLAQKCLKVAISSDGPIVFDGGVYNNWFKEPAASLLASMYIHASEEVYSERASVPVINWRTIEYDPDAAASLLPVLDNTDNEYSVLISKVNNAVKRLRQQEEQRKRNLEQTYVESLKLDNDALNRLSTKCDDYATIKGVCWALSENEIRSVLATRGYSVKQNEKDSFYALDGSKIRIRKNSSEFDCQDGDSERGNSES